MADPFNSLDQALGKGRVVDPEEFISKYASENGVDPGLVRAVAKQESNFNPQAVGKVTKSGERAQGVMQLMPATQKRHGVNDPFDMAQNIEGGTKELKRLLDRYGGDQAKALAAYNAGEGAVDKAGGVPNFPETKQYVQNVQKNYKPDPFSQLDAALGKGREVQQSANAGVPTAPYNPAQTGTNDIMQRTGKYWSDVAGNVLPTAGRAAKSLLWDFPVALGQMGRYLALGPGSEMPDWAKAGVSVAKTATGLGNEQDRATTQQIGHELGKSIPGVNLVEGFREDPVGVVLNWAGLLHGVSSKLGAAGKVSEGLLNAPADVAGGIANRLETSATKRYTRALSPHFPSNVVGRELGEEVAAGRKGLQEGISLSIKPSMVQGIPQPELPKALARTNEIRQTANEEVQKVVNGLQSQGNMLDGAGLKNLADDAFDYVRDKMVHSDPEVLKYIEQQRDVEKVRVWHNPDVYDPATGKKLAPIPVQEATPRMLQGRKVQLGKEIQQNYENTFPEQRGTMGAVDVKIKKALRFQYRQKLEEWAPELKDLNQGSAESQLLDEAIDNFVKKRYVNPKQASTKVGYIAGRIAGVGFGAGIGGFFGGYPGASLGGALGIGTAMLIGDPKVEGAIAKATYAASKMARAGSGLGPMPVIGSRLVAPTSGLGDMPTPPPSFMDNVLKLNRMVRGQQ